MSVTSGPTSPRQFVFFDREGSCWRTWPAISLWGSETYSGTWPKRGSMRSGACFEHPTWEPPTSGHDSSSSLPTPTRRDHKGRNQRDDATCLPGAVALLPTPRTSDTNGAGLHGNGGMDPRTTVTLLPTPVVNDMGAGKTPEAWDEWTSVMQERHGNGNGHGRSLAIEAARLLPTPKSQGNRAGRKALTQQHWCAPQLEQALELMQGRLPREYENWDEVQGWHGASTSPPSADGSTPSDDPPPDPLMTPDD